jgi:hypothetical protein
VTMARGSEAFSVFFWVLLPPKLQRNLVVNWLCEPLRNAEMRKRLSYFHSGGREKGKRRSNQEGAGVVVKSSVF